MGGSGGTGLFGLQMAKLMGTGTVATVCSAKNGDLCREYGADVVCAYDGGEEALKAALAAAGPFDCCYDTVSSPDDPPYEHLVRPVLKRNGQLVAINGKLSDFVRAMMSGGCLGNIQRSNFKIVILGPGPKVAADLDRVAAWVADKKARRRRRRRRFCALLLWGEPTC